MSAVVVSLLVVAGCVLFAGRAVAAAGPVVYVAPSGSGSTCTSTAPCDIQSAQTLVRSMNAGMTADITVQLATGTYRLTSPLSMDSRDSGTGGHNVVWTAAAGASPVISGGKQITGWTLSDAAKNIWTAPAPSGLQTRQLYVNGVRAQRAMGAVPVKLTQTSTGYTASSSAMSTWGNPSNIEFVYEGGDRYWSRGRSAIDGWEEERCPVASISGTTITMAEPCWTNSTQRPVRTSGTGAGRTVNLVGAAGLSGSPTYVENAYEVLDQPGEWYLDSTAHTISYIPRAGESVTAADVEAPSMESLVVGAGTAAAPISNIVFSGIRFAYATWNDPSTGEGFSEIQANYRLTGPNGASAEGLCNEIAGGTCPYGAWTKEPGNVSFSYAHNVQFLRDDFVHLGAAGLDLGDGAQNTLVQGCVFTDISGNGLELGGVDNPLPSATIDHTTGNQILNNHLYALPVEYHGGIGIDVGYTENTLISHNQIDHTPYSGISIGWGGWLDKAAEAPQANYSNHNVLSDNLVFTVMNRLADGAAIYSNGITGTSYLDGEQEIGNVAHDGLNQTQDFYTDNGSDWITLTGNTSYNSWRDSGNSHLDYNPGATTTYDPTYLQANFWSEYNSDGNFTSRANRQIAGPADVPAATLSNAGIQSGYADILTQSFGSAVPNAPDDVAAFGANGAAYVGFAPSYVENGAPVTSYTVTASPGGQTATVNASGFLAKPYAVVPGLTNGTAYTFTVTATNATGTSVSSLPSAAVTPTAGAGAVPAAPTAVHATVDATDNRAAVTWTFPTSTGDTPIIGYTVSAPGLPTQVITTRGAIVASTHSPQVVFNGLKPGTSYTFSVTAQNAVGSSAAGTYSMGKFTTPALATTYNNAGTSTDNVAGDANFDGSGYSLSAQALAAAGVTPGGTVTAGGQTFTWPNITPTATPGPNPPTADNTVASGQNVTIPGSTSGTTLGFLAASTGGGATTGTGTITYTDGSTQTYTLNVPDWYQAAPTDSTVAITMTYRNTPAGTPATHAINIYYLSIPLQTGKTVASVTLPNTSAIPDKTVRAMHIFTATIN